MTSDEQIPDPLTPRVGETWATAREQLFQLVERAPDSAPVPEGCFQPVPDVRVLPVGGGAGFVGWMPPNVLVRRVRTIEQNMGLAA